MIRRKEKAHSTASGIAILRQRVIEHGCRKGWSRARIIFTLWRHEKRCKFCQMLIAVDDQRAEREANIVRRRPYYTLDANAAAEYSARSLSKNLPLH